MWTALQRKVKWKLHRKTHLDVAIMSLAAIDAAKVSKPRHALGSDLQNLVSSIRSRTTEYNLNNITRTNAYFKIYQRRPELHWALLAHMVSRNGGYNMTDLKGEWFTRLDETVPPEHIFSFIEQANWSIFDDAYPQLLLYDEGRNRNQNLSHLLPELGVSKFMKPIWDAFWLTVDSPLLTYALIINEQNHIENCVIEHASYQKQVLHTFEFVAQSLLGFNQVLFPHVVHRSIRLSGSTVHHFTSIDERIFTGMRLYQTLFPNLSPLEGVLAFATSVDHTGSRADYWSDVFSPRPVLDLRDPYVPVFLSSGENSAWSSSVQRRIYSPRLTDVWRDVPHSPEDAEDWYTDASMALYLNNHSAKPDSHFEQTYTETVERIERTILLKERLRRATGHLETKT